MEKLIEKEDENGKIYYEGANKEDREKMAQAFLVIAEAKHGFDIMMKGIREQATAMGREERNLWGEVSKAMPDQANRERLFYDQEAQTIRVRNINSSKEGE